MNTLGFCSLYPLSRTFGLLMLLTAVCAHALGPNAQISMGQAPLAVAVNSVTNKIYVVNSGDGTVSVVNGATHSTTKVKVGPNPGSIAINPSTNKIYIANGGDGSVSVIDGATNAVTRVAVGGRPYAIVVNDVTNKTYVTNLANNSVNVIDNVSNAVSGVSVGMMPLSLALNVMTGKVYVANYGSGNVTVIDGTTNQTSTIKVGASPVSIAVNPASNKIYVANRDANSVSRIDGTNNAVTAVSVGLAPQGIAVDSTIDTVYVANSGDGTVSVLDETKRLVTVRRSEGMQSPAVIAILPGTSLVAVNDPANNALVVFQQQQSIGSINFVPTGTNPIAFAFHQHTGTLYVANFGSNSLSVVDMLQPIANSVPNRNGASPYTTVANPVNGKLYFADGSPNVGVWDGRASTTTNIGVGLPARAIGVNPITGKVYVTTRDPLCATSAKMGSLKVIEGTSIKKSVPMARCPISVAVNAVTDTVYVVNYDANNVTKINGTTGDVLGTIAVAKPLTVVTNPRNNKVYIGDESNHITIIDESNGSRLMLTVPVHQLTSWSIAVSEATNQIYAMKIMDETGSSTDLIVIDGATNQMTLVPMGGDITELAINPLTGRAYVGVTDFSTSRIKVVQGAMIKATIALPAATAFDPSILLVDAAMNRIYVAAKGDNSISVIDGATNKTMSSVGVPNVFIGAFSSFDGAAYFASGIDLWRLSTDKGGTASLATTIAPLPGNRTTSASVSFNLSAVSRLTPTTTVVRQVYYQLDTQAGTWKRATVNGANWQASLNNLTNGVHVLYAFATDGEDATASSPSQSSAAKVGKVAAYAFVKTP